MARWSPHGSQECDAGPAVLVVAGVDVGTLGVLNSNGDEIGVQKGDGLVVGQRGLVHALAEATPESPDVQHDEFVLLLSCVERFLPPLTPVDEIGLVGIRRESEHSGG